MIQKHFLKKDIFNGTFYQNKSSSTKSFFFPRKSTSSSVNKKVNMNNNTVTVLNSLGSKCSAPAYCGSLEVRSFATMESYLRGISQKSICIVTYE